MNYPLLALVVCFVTINNFAHAYDDEDLEDDVLHTISTIYPKVLAADAHAPWSLVKSAKKDDDLDDGSRRFLRRPQTPAADDDVIKSLILRRSEGHVKVVRSKVKSAQRGQVKSAQRGQVKSAQRGQVKSAQRGQVKSAQHGHYNVVKSARQDLSALRDYVILDGAECLKDEHVRRMAECLARTFNKANFLKGVVMNKVRDYISKKNVIAWFKYIGEEFNIPLDLPNISNIVKCYVNQIPT